MNDERTRRITAEIARQCPEHGKRVRRQHRIMAVATWASGVLLGVPLLIEGWRISGFALMSLWGFVGWHSWQMSNELFRSWIELRHQALSER